MSQHNSDFFTVKQLAARHPAFTEASLRYHIFMAAPRATKQAGYSGNGLQRAIIRVGRKVLISESEFLAWVKGQDVASGGK